VLEIGRRSADRRNCADDLAAAIHVTTPGDWKMVGSALLALLTPPELAQRKANRKSNVQVERRAAAIRRAVYSRRVRSNAS
jgi:hypothetical protein